MSVEMAPDAGGRMCVCVCVFLFFFHISVLLNVQWSHFTTHELFQVSRFIENFIYLGRKLI